MAGILDPWDWDTSRVVQELCTEQRTWKPPSIPPKLPNAERLKQSLEDNEVDGQSLLGSASDAPDFWSDLGIKIIKHKETLRDAISQFRRTSRKYKIWKLRQSEEDDDDYGVSVGGLDRLDEASRKRKIKEERKGESAKSSLTTIEAVLSELSTSAVAQQAATHANHSPLMRLTPRMGPFNDLAKADEPVQKKRRIAPITLTGVRAEDLRNIPQGNLRSDLAPEEGEAVAAACAELSGAYIGQDILNRADVIAFNCSTEPLTTKDLEFESGQDPYPIGLRRQRARFLRRYLMKPQYVFRPSKADMVPGGYDPEHYEVLPVYGESDDDCDSETWEEYLKEEDERKKLRKKLRAYLSDEEKSAIVDKLVFEKVAAWKSIKLPALEYKANRMWNKARRQGLKQAIARESQLIVRYQQRLDAYRGEIIKQPWTDEADVRKVEGVLDQTVADLEYSTWLVNMLRCPDEPKKLSRAPRKQKVKAPREKMMDSDEEILASDSESDELEFTDFIVGDEAQIHDEVLIGAGQDKPSLANLENSASPDRILDVNNGKIYTTSEELELQLSSSDLVMAEDHEKDVPMDLSAGADSEPEEKVTITKSTVISENRHAAISPQLRDSPITSATTAPAKLANENGPATDIIEEEETLDLTEPILKVKIETSSTPKHPKAHFTKLHNQIEVVDLVTPEKAKAIIKPVQMPKRLQFGSPRFLQPSQMQANELDGSRTIISNLINNLDEVHRSTLFSFALWKVDELWNGFIVPSLRSPYLPKLPLDSEKDQDLFYGLHLARLFDAFLGREPQHLRRWFMSQEGRIQLESEEKRFEAFVHTLRELSLNYKIGVIPPKKLTPPLLSAKETPKNLDGADTDVDGDMDDASADESSPENRKRRPVIKRDQAAMNLRESDVRRVQEQAERTKALRIKLALLGDTNASQNMRLIINETKQDDQGFIYVPDNIAGRIKDHQISGVRFMWNQVVTEANVRQGCLLAHTMGLGKTMQIITLLMTIADAASSDDSSVSSQIPEDLKESKTLILAPPGLVNNWLEEFLWWTLDSNHRLGEVYKIDSTFKPYERAGQLDRWATQGGVLLIGYDMFRSLMKTDMIRTQLLESPNLIVADEAHILKNPKSKINQYTGEFKSHVRIALTGSPLANNVQEYYSMINWIAPNYLGDPSEFRQVFAQTIESGLSVDSTKYERRRALVKLRSLKETVAPKVHRRTIHALKDELPQKTEFVISVPLTEMQRRAYEIFLNYDFVEGETAKLFATLQMLALLCNHPACFRGRLMKAWKNEKNVDDATKEAALPQKLVSEELTLIRHQDTLGEAAESHSWKIPLFNKIVHESIQQGDKLLVFSQSIPTLDYLESVLNRQKRSFIRLDGSTTMNKRQDMVKDFNTSTEAYDVFLLSTTAGGYGLNITGANRVIIFDFKFNPQHEQQAVGRAYRLGQKKHVYVYRFICGGTFEEKMQNKGVFKLQLASRVVDKKNPIPKAQRFEEMFAKPVEPIQRDLSPFLGKDSVLDAVIDSSVGKGIRSIVLADTFEEENLEDEQLTNEEAQEAKQLIEMHQARLTGKPFTAVAAHLLPLSDFSLNPPPSTALPTTSVPPSNGVNGLHVPGVLAQHHAEPSIAALPAKTSIVSSSSVAAAVPKNLDGAPHPSFQSGTVQPVLGLTTQVRGVPTQADNILTASELNFWGNAKIFKGELSRLFTVGETDASAKDRKKQVAQQIVDAFTKSAEQRDHHDSAQAKIALVESAQSPYFVDAILKSKDIAQQLASLSANDIRQLSLQLASEIPNKRDEQTEQQPTFEKAHHNPPKHTVKPNDHTVSESSYNAQSTPFHLQTQSPRSMGRAASVVQPEQQKTIQRSSIFQREPLAPVQRKSHKHDDQAVLQELKAQGDAKNRGLSLPGWAKEAVVSQGRSVTSSSASPAPSAAPVVRRAKNPFQ